MGKAWLPSYSPKFKERVRSLDLFLFPVQIQTDVVSVYEVGALHDWMLTPEDQCSSAAPSGLSKPGL